MIRGLEVDVRGDNNLVVFGEGSWLKDLRVVIYGSSNQIIVGRGTQFSGPGKLWVEDDRGELRIGDGCTIEPGGTLGGPGGSGSHSRPRLYGRCRRGGPHRGLARDTRPDVRRD